MTLADEIRGLAAASGGSFSARLDACAVRAEADAKRAAHAQVQWDAAVRETVELRSAIAALLVRAGKIPAGTDPPTAVLVALLG